MMLSLNVVLLLLSLTLLQARCQAVDASSSSSSSISDELKAKRIPNKGDSWKKYKGKQFQEQEQCPKPKLKKAEGNSSYHMPSFLIRPIRRVRSKDMTVEEFQTKFSRSDVAIPIIFENPDFDESPWTPASFIKECGDVPIVNEETNYHNVRRVNPDLVGTKWAGLVVPDLQEQNITTLKDLIHAQGTPQGKDLYLHDAPLSYYCPPKVDQIKVPKYFPRNYDAMEWDPKKIGLSAIELEKQWPSIFISKQNTGSRLHADSRMTRFYTQVLLGAKLWRVTPPSEYWRLGANMDPETEFFPAFFEADIMNTPNFEKHPNLDGTLIYEAVLKPGDVLFVPEGWPHQVHNLEESVMTSMNFFDNAVLDFAIQCLDYEDYDDNSGTLALWKAFFMPFDDPVFNEEQDMPMTEFLRAQHLQVIAVPKWFEEKVREEPDWMIHYRDPDGYPGLHVAVEYNFVNMVEFLLEGAGVDVNFVDRKGITALDLATILRYEEMTELLLEFGALTGKEIEIAREKDL